MQSTNPKHLRAHMKSFLDLAAQEPLRILRRTGEAYILVNEQQFAKLQRELVAMQRRLIALDPRFADNDVGQDTQKVDVKNMSQYF